MRRQKGITLIALVITIIVLLILAGVSITMMSGEDGIVTKASDAAQKTDKASEEELESLGKVNDYIDSAVSGNTNLDDDDNSDDDTSVELPDGWDPLVVDGVVTEGTRTAPIPKGYVSSQIEGENKISTGLVIYEGTEPVTGTANSTAHETAMTTRNQYVWIPVDDMDSMFLSNGYGKVYYYGGTFTDVSDNEFLEANKSYIDVNKTDDSIYDTAFIKTEDIETYKGFYISRYEVNSSCESKKGQTVLQDTDFETARQNFLNAFESNPNIYMAYDCHYDQVALFIGDEALSGHTDRNLATDGTVYTTGANSLDVMKNIYDYEGNCFEVSASTSAGANGFFLSSGNRLVSLTVNASSFTLDRIAASARYYLPFDTTGDVATRICLKLQ